MSLKQNKEQNLDHFFRTCYSKQNFFATEVHVVIS